MLYAKSEYEMDVDIYLKIKQSTTNLEVENLVLTSRAGSSRVNYTPSEDHTNHEFNIVHHIRHLSLRDEYRRCIVGPDIEFSVMFDKFNVDINPNKLGLGQTTYTITRPLSISDSNVRMSNHDLSDETLQQLNRAIQSIEFMAEIEVKVNIKNKAFIKQI